ncbi:unnamed protein product [Didymodactylos carnosus]|uniref:Spore protein YkvP/CgeB glycosyl transferase-like domain-containing protein n=1 Tax=Didymodactylos carnosus TaxID=1234261 RepID=A0A815SWB3_9BILA|nr:unnamed protein product [Didymodactylos carnosus]CAF1494106.1 unnamed protein product [Didymodactylos carnosus]CAF4092822.1 unnamed protein product [Didymodactylos carnosus]CAF4357011.1 unnamed protein product [Didymodactylos carnosus]
MTREHECWAYRCIPDLIDYNVSILLQTYAYEMDLYHKSVSYNRVIQHSPTSAEPLIFYPPLTFKNKSVHIRDIDVLVVGALNPFVYPLRTRIAQMIRDKKINGHVHQHPGYFNENNTVEISEKQYRTYAALLHRAKLVIIGATRYYYAISKFSEVALAGCLIISEIPYEREDEFRSYIVELSMNMTDTEIKKIIDYWVTHSQEREQRAAKGQMSVLNRYTWDHNIDLSIQAVLKYKRREFGIYHNYPYSLKCVPVDNSDHGGFGRWCNQQSIALKHTPLRTPCICNRTWINFIDEDSVLEGLRNQSDMNTTRQYLVPIGYLKICDTKESIQDTVRYSPWGSACICNHTNWWRGRSSVCYVSNTALSISKHLTFTLSHQNYFK